MGGSSYLALIFTAILVLWILYGQVRSRPEQFSLPNVERSLFTLGLLALALIAFLSLVIVGSNMLEVG